MKARNKWTVSTEVIVIVVYTHTHTLSLSLSLSPSLYGATTKTSNAPRSRPRPPAFIVCPIPTQLCLSIEGSCNKMKCSALSGGDVDAVDQKWRARMKQSVLLAVFLLRSDSDRRENLEDPPRPTQAVTHSLSLSRCNMKSQRERRGWKKGSFGRVGLSAQKKISHQGTPSTAQLPRENERSDAPRFLLTENLHRK